MSSAMIRRPVRQAKWAAVPTVLVLLALVASAAGAAPGYAGDQPGVAPLPRAMAVEPNRGQVSPGVQYVARLGGATLLFRAEGLDRALARRLGTVTPQDLHPGLRFVDSSAGSVLAAGPRQPATASYFFGNDASRWLSGVPIHDGVTYRGLYPGVDLRYDDGATALNGTYVIEPGADPRVIGWEYTGDTDARVDEQGNLLLAVAPAVQLVEPRPVAWQLIDGARHEVPASFLLRRDGSVGFAVGSFDTSAPLTISPAGAAGGDDGGGGAAATVDPEGAPPCAEGSSCTRWATFLGSGIGIGPHSVRVGTDRDGNVYVAGNTACPGCFPTVNPLQSTYDAGAAYIMMFVSKFDPTGSTLLYSTYFGGPDGAALRDLAVSDDGTVYLAGDTPSSEYPVTGDAYQDTFGGGSIYGDAVVSKISPDGQQLLYSTYLGGGGEDGLWGIDLNAAGDVGLVGFSTRIVPEALNTVVPIGYPATPGAYQEVSRSPVLTDYDAVVTRLGEDGSLAWSTGFGGQAPDFGHDVAVDDTGNVHVVGTTYSDDFPTTPGAPQPTHASPDEAADNFVAVFGDAGGALVRSTLLGGDGDEGPAGIAVDAAGATYVAGATTSTNFPTSPGAYQSKIAGAGDAFVSKIDASGSVVYATYLGGSGADSAGPGMVAVDGSGRAHVTGSTPSSDHPASAGAPQRAYAGGSSDAFVSVFDASGGRLVSSSFLGGGQPIPDPCNCPAGTAQAADRGRAVTVDGNGDVIIVGTTNAPDFPTTPGSFKPVFTGTASRWAQDRSEVFVARLRMTD